MLLATFGASVAVAQTPTAATQADLALAKSVYVQGSWAEHGTDGATLGMTLPWQWRRDLWNGEVRGHWDAYVTRLSFDGARDYNHTWLIGLVPTLRWRPDAGRSPWFVEAGIGVTYMSDRYVTVHKEFSTSFNFASHLGLGYNFGAQRAHEMQVRYEHLSNAGIDHPNPGENTLQLRYAYHF
ncbi:acyloxyacyl hydrolase [Diaphorobacter aerolatus]|uniref:acyloxyacyl hydrolase n=1 Tax=Diaphorobacter aerolatus TaxID=1288495 RepID=UPI001D0105E4|nr:acyloxyacyl hydrolase [Diaphorobacter aerolatus]